ncbi:MAG: CU044_2847 family protein [Bacteroidia bacterium]|nr:CU044_2847 family protein [Bacteroidia bacterium]
MATQYLEFEDENGETLLVEVESASAQSGRVPVRGGGDENPATIKTGKKLEAALAPLRTIASSVINKLKGLELQPDEVSLELGMKINAESTIVIAKAGGEAHLKVTLTWKKSEAPQPPAASGTETPAVA